MKKVLYLFTFVLMATVSLADSIGVCESGVIEFGRNGKCYCRSGKSSFSSAQTFFAGLAWCDGQGLSRATVQSICDYDTNEKWSASNRELCPNFNNWQTLTDSTGETLAEGLRNAGTLSPRGGGLVMRLLLGTGRTNGVLNEEVYANTRMWAYCDVPQSICNTLHERLEAIPQ